MQVIRVPGSGTFDKITKVLDEAPALLNYQERLMLFNLIYCLRPKRYLEIGSWVGGSAYIVSAAMDMADYDGRIFCVDPLVPELEEDLKEHINHRTTYVNGYSPAALEEARKESDSDFDFFFIDGDHSKEAVWNDGQACLKCATKGAYLLFHDAFNDGVNQAIDEVRDSMIRVATSRGRVNTTSRFMVDFGMLTSEKHGELFRVPEATGDWGGFRMLRVPEEIKG